MFNNTMYLHLLSIFLTVFVFSGSQGQPLLCRPNDEDCNKLQQARFAYALAMAGNPLLGVPSSDPLNVHEIDGRQSTAHYVFTNCKVTGFKDCQLQSVKSNLKEMTAHIDLRCPALTITGDYEMNGRLLTLPIEGKGKFTIASKSYDIGIDGTIQMLTKENGSKYRNFKDDFKFTKLDAAAVTYQYENLFNGNKDQADAAIKFVNENWKEVTNELQNTVFKSIFKQIVKHSNMYFKSVST